MKTPARFPGSRIFSLCAAFLFLAAGAHAATTLVPARVARFANTTLLTTPASNGTAFQIGDNASETVFNIVLNFSISSSTADIAAANLITFTVTPTSQTGTGPDIQLFSISGKTDNTIVAGDRTAGVLVSTVVASSVTAADLANAPITFDVTDAVKAASLANDTNISFAMRGVFPGDLPANGDGGVDIFVFGTLGTNDAQLNIIPEPASLALIAAGAGLLFRRRR